MTRESRGQKTLAPFVCGELPIRAAAILKGRIMFCDAEHRIIQAIAVLCDSDDANDRAMCRILSLATARWQIGTAAGLEEQLGACNNWQHANLTQLQPSMN